jgi:hypothetical protein
MKAATIKGVDQDLAEKLKATSKKQGKSVNQLTIELIRASLGLDKEKNYHVNTMTWMICLAGGPKKNSRRLILTLHFFPACKWPFSWLS